MKMIKCLILMILMLSLMTSVSSASDLHNLTVDDKHIVFNYLDTHHIVHTKEFGDITVSFDMYEKIWINDTIEVDINSWGIMKYIKSTERQ